MSWILKTVAKKDGLLTDVKSHDFKYQFTQRTYTYTYRYYCCKKCNLNMQISYANKKIGYYPSTFCIKVKNCNQIIMEKVLE